MESFVRYSFFSVLLIIICTSCSRFTERRQAREAIHEAGLVMEQYPDSAYRLLRSIFHYKILPEEEQMTYRLLLLQSKDKSDHDITADTAIIDVQHYFAQQQDWQKAALAAFCLGRVRQERNDDHQTMQAYLDAENYAGYTSDYRLRGMIQHNIGYLYGKQQDYKRSMAATKKSIAYFQLADSTAYKCTVAALQQLGGSFFAQKQLDSTIYYCQKALEIAIVHNDTLLQSTLFHALSVVYTEKGDIEKLRAALSKVSIVSMSQVNKARFYSALSKFYTRIGQLDTSAFYANQALQLLDTLKDANMVYAAIYYSFYEQEEARKDCKQALNQENKKNAARLLRRFKEIVYDTQDGNYWLEVYGIINHYYDDKLESLRQYCAGLEETEFKICCLSLADFRNDEMAVFLNLSINTIQAKKTHIRKKLNLGERGDIKDFLLQYTI